MTLYYRYGGPVSDDQALEVQCPECLMPVGEGCVYIWPKSVNPNSTRVAQLRSRAVRDLITRVGTPTAKPHNGRRALYSIREDRGTRLRKLRQLRDWLLANEDLFKEVSDA